MEYIIYNYIRSNTNRRVLAGGNGVGQTQGEKCFERYYKYNNVI